MSVIKDIEDDNSSQFAILNPPITHVDAALRINSGMVNVDFYWPF